LEQKRNGQGGVPRGGPRGVPREVLEFKENMQIM
jgi:hypothetical protein